MKFLPHQNRARVQIPMHPSKKLGTQQWLVILVLGRGNRGIPGAGLPASLAESVSASFSERLSPKVRWGLLDEDAQC